MPMPAGPLWSFLHIVIKYPGVTAVTVAGYVAITSSGHLFTDETPEYTIPKITHNVPDSGPMIALTFDDGWRSVYDVALPEMNRRGLIGTNYITSGFIDSWDDPEGYISSEHVIEFANAGWEIGAHSINHDHLPELSESEIIDNLLIPQEVLVDLSHTPVTAFSTPYGEFNDIVINNAKSTYETHVNAWSDAKGINTLENFDMYNIHRLDTAQISVEGVCETVSTLGEDEFYVIIFHRITDIPDTYNVSPDDFNAMLDCVEESEVNVVTVSDGAQSMLARIEE